MSRSRSNQYPENMKVALIAYYCRKTMSIKA